jgi:hypothetical protein
MNSMSLANRTSLVSLIALITLACMCNLGPSLVAAPTSEPYQYQYPTALLQPQPLNPVTLPTTCNPIITANMNVNIRKGPSKTFDSVGVLDTGNYMSVVGMSESQYGEWWYVAYPPATSGYGWVWGDAVTPSCIPTNLQVIAAPPTPKTQASGGQPPQATETSAPPPAGGGSWGQTQADLAVTDLYPDNWPLGEIFVRVTTSWHHFKRGEQLSNSQLSITYSEHRRMTDQARHKRHLARVKQGVSHIHLIDDNLLHEVSCEIVPVIAIKFG